MTLFQTILVPTDFSPHAAKALELAIELAKEQGAALCLAHVYDLLPYATVPEGMPMYDPGVLSQLRDDLAKLLATSKEQALKAGVERVDAKLLDGQPFREIVRLAEQLPAQLIVMGTHGRGGIAHALVGSVAERVVRKAPCPVITVPLKEAKKK
jgi:nucleotide-binding universal stress UspA family protein